MTRRDFIGAGAAFAAGGARMALAGQGAEPLMRLGMIADVHLATGDDGRGVQNCLCFEPALRYFDERGAERTGGQTADHRTQRFYL